LRSKLGWAQGRPIITYSGLLEANTVLSSFNTIQPSSYYLPEVEYWKYSMGQKNGLQAFVSQMLEAAPGRFGPDPGSSDSLRKAEFFGYANNA